MDRLRTERHPGVVHNGGLKSDGVKAEVWVDTVMEGGRKFMAAWRKEEVDAARHRQEKREATRLGKLSSHTDSCRHRILRSDTHRLADEPRESLSLYGPETDRDLRSAYRHVDASKFYFIFSERAAWGGGGALPDLFFCYFSPVQQTTSGIGHHRVK